MCSSQMKHPYRFNTNEFNIQGIILKTRGKTEHNRIHSSYSIPFENSELKFKDIFLEAFSGKSTPLPKMQLRLNAVRSCKLLQVHILHQVTTHSLQNYLCCPGTGRFASSLDCVNIVANKAKLALTISQDLIESHQQGQANKTTSLELIYRLSF